MLLSRVLHPNKVKTTLKDEFFTKSEHRGCGVCLAKLTPRLLMRMPTLPFKKETAHRKAMRAAMNQVPMVPFKNGKKSVQRKAKRATMMRVTMVHFKKRMTVQRTD